MKDIRETWILWPILIILLVCISGACEGISCFECNSVDDNFCPDVMSSDDEGIVTLSDCSSLFEAEYCVKTTGVTGGSLGTRRFCSSRDMGNYCEYIKRPGDQLEYRSCVFTCTGNGCNGAISTTFTSFPSIYIILTTSVLSFIFSHADSTFFFINPFTSR